MIALTSRRTLAFVSLAGIAAAPGVVTAQQAAAPGAVTGIVYDSVARAPLAGAMVELVSRSQGATALGGITDSVGAYHITGVPAGRYVIGFDHVALVALGIATPLREVDIGAAGTALTENLSIPAPRAVREQRCARGTPGSADGMLAGFVRDADAEAALPGASVEISWREVAVGKGRMQMVRRTATAPVNELGSYVACGLPTDGRLTVRASARSHLSGPVDVELPDGGAARLDLMVADSSQLSTVSDSAGVRHLRGTATVLGRVRHADGRPFSGAHVGIVALGTETLARDDGGFTLDHLPSGTWTLETRAIGYEPVALPVVLSTARPTRASLTIDEKIYTLDAVVIRGERGPMVRLMDDIAKRKRLLGGTYFMAGDRQIESAWTVTDIIKSARGYKVTDVYGGAQIVNVGTDTTRRHTVLAGTTGESIRITGQTGVGMTCVAHVFIDGHEFPPGMNEVDRTLTPKEILAIESYPSFNDTPVQWRGPDTCGSIVIWTKRLGQ